jgi:hypothetical protein
MPDKESRDPEAGPGRGDRGPHPRAAMETRESDTPDPASARKPSKYQPLADWLAAQPDESVTLTVSAIEQILGFRLPRSGWVHVAWWRPYRTDYPHVLAWRAAGWEVASLDWPRREVTFVRMEREA